MVPGESKTVGSPGKFKGGQHAAESQKMGVIGAHGGGHFGKGKESEAMDCNLSYDVNHLLSDDGDKLTGWPFVLTWTAAIVLSWALVIAGAYGILSLFE